MNHTSYNINNLVNGVQTIVPEENCPPDNYPLDDYLSDYCPPDN